MRRTDVAAALVAAAWGYLFITGVDGLRAMQLRFGAGPAPAQVRLYAGIPAACLIAIILAFFLSRKARWFDRVYPVFVVLVFFLLLPTLMMWAGGV